MPVTVKELVVRATVSDNNTNEVSSMNNEQLGMRQDERDSLISDCVDQVLEVLNMAKER